MPIILKRYRRQSAWKHRKTFQKSQRWTRQELQDYQWQKLSELLDHAYQSCHYYRRIFNERDLTPASFKSPEDLQKLPILTRHDTFDHLDELISTRFRRQDLYRFYTGGTTGQQAKLFVDRESFNLKLAAAWRFEQWMGCEPCDKIALFWPAHMDIPDRESWKAKFARLHMMRQDMIHGGFLSDETAVRISKQLSGFGPTYMKVFPTCFSDFIEQAQALKLPLPRLKGIMSTGEVLYPRQREILENVFDCPVFDMYGSREVGNTCAECEQHNGMHITMETSLVEFVADGCPVAAGQEGEMLITDLTNYAMPMIRYQINDFGVPRDDECDCGRGLTLMDSTVGRLQDFVYSTDGKRHSGHVLGIHMTVAEDGVEIGQVQFVQKSLTEFLVRITDKPTPTAETLSYLERRMKDILGETLAVRFDIVDHIPAEPSGKTRFMICDMEPPIQAE